MSEEIDRNVYANAKSTRPGWANALIVAAVILVAGVVMTLMSGISVGGWFFTAAGVAAVVAGILALTGIKKSGA